MVLGFLGRDLAGVDQVLHEGVVSRDLGHRVSPQHVGARVADVDHGEALPERMSAMQVVPRPSPSRSRLERS